MKISKLQKKIGQFTLQIEELYLESGKVHGLIGTKRAAQSTGKTYSSTPAQK